MAVNDRLFEPPAVDLARINARLAALPDNLRASIRRAGDALATGDLDMAGDALGSVLAVAPGQADALRLSGLLLARVGNVQAAHANLEGAIRAAPDDAMGYWQYAQILEQTGNHATARQVRERAMDRVPGSALAHADLGEDLVRHQCPEQALPLLDRATRLGPDYAPAWLSLGSAQVACGRATDGAASVRKAIALEPAFGAAWLALADIQTVSASDAEVDRMRSLVRGGEVDEAERTAILFALARVCEGRGLYAEAHGLFTEANARRRREVGVWNERAFLDARRRAADVFGTRRADPADSTRGDEVIFIAGVPRSGTTLVEQVLAAHPGVQALGELGDLARVLTEESTRRRRRYPEWVPDARDADWQRLGRQYLELIAPRRDGRLRCTDKMPNNWQALGAIRAMLPGARIVLCRRDPLETCWSCFKQFFPRGWELTSDIGQLATFWKEFDRDAAWWAARVPAAVRVQGYEALTDHPDAEIRALLDFCGLPFDAACLAPHRARRSVHTLSAAQVRDPIHRHAATAAAYGKLMDPLRAALGLPPDGAASAHQE